MTGQYLVNVVLNLKLICPIYRDDNALVDKDGHVYYQDASAEGKYESWYWDNNEYDLLTERSVKKIEVLNLTYEEPIHDITKRYDGHDISQSKVIFTNGKYNGTSKKTKTLTMSFTTSKSWSHSVQFGVTFGVEVEVREVQ